MAARWLFLVNTIAGNGAGADAWTRIEAWLRESQIPYIVEFPDSIEATSRIIRLRSIEPLHGVVAVGGDGTVHGVVNGVLHVNHAGGGYLPIGIVPIGQQNDFARNFGLAVNKPLAATRYVVQKAVQRQVDVGVLTSPALPQPLYIANGVLIGISERFAEMWSGEQNPTWSATLDYWRHYTPQTFTITYADRSRTQPMTVVAYTNGARHLGGLQFAPAARTDDGKMELTLIRAVSRFAAADLLSRARQGKLTPHVAVTQEYTDSVLIRSDTEIPFLLDGESLNLPIHELEISVMVGGMVVLV